MEVLILDTFPFSFSLSMLFLKVSLIYLPT